MRLKAGIVALLLAAFVTSCSGCGHVKVTTTNKQEVFTDLAKSTVRVNTSVIDKDDNQGGGIGTGIVVDVNEHGTIILTCNHVIDNANDPTNKKQDITVTFKFDGKKMTYIALVLKTDPTRDMALLFAPGMSEQKALYVSMFEPNLYSELYLMGHPLGYPNVPSTALLYSKHVVPGGTAGRPILWALSNGVVIFGISGGPVVNEQGRLVCMVNSLARDEFHTALELDPSMPAIDVKIDMAYTQLGFCVPMTSIKDFIGEYVK